MSLTNLDKIIMVDQEAMTVTVYTSGSTRQSGRSDVRSLSY